MIISIIISEVPQVPHEKSKTSLMKSQEAKITKSHKSSCITIFVNYNTFTSINIDKLKPLKI